MKRALIQLLRWGIPLAFIAWLLTQASRDQSFEQLRDHPKDWWMLLAAFAVCLLAVALTFVRWFFLVRALDLPFRMADAFRLGFLGYLLNFVSLGSVGGDLLKAVFVAREHPKRRAEAVATVVIDRVLGLYAMLLLASGTILITGIWWREVSQPVRVLCQAIFWCTALGGLGVVAMIIPGFTGGKVTQRLASLPKVGPTFRKLIDAVRIYRSKPGVLAGAVALSILAQALFCATLYLIARGILPSYPSLVDHMVIGPLAMLTGVLPLPVNGLGALEYVIDSLYQQIPLVVTTLKGQGLIVSLGYRVITVLIALIGVCIYLLSRREVDSMLHEAEDVEQAEDVEPATVAAVPVVPLAPRRAAG